MRATVVGPALQVVGVGEYGSMPPAPGYAPTNAMGTGAVSGLAAADHPKGSYKPVDSGISTEPTRSTPARDLLDLRYAALQKARMVCKLMKAWEE